MDIKNFHNFKISGKIYEVDGGVEQNQPSKSGGKYKENMKYKTEDTGDDSSGLYITFLTQAGMVINSMGTNLNMINPDKAGSATSKIAALTSSLEPTYESHKALWSGIEELSNYLGGDYQNVSKGELSSETKQAFDPSGKVLDSFKQSMADLQKRKDTKAITDTQYDEEASDLRKDTDSQLDKTRGLYFSKIGQSLNYYMQATKVFKKGALVCLQNMESEDKKTGKNYLNKITKSAINILGKR